MSIIDQGLVLAGAWSESISQNCCSRLHHPWRFLKPCHGAKFTPAATCSISQEIIVPWTSLFASPAKAQPLKEQADKPRAPRIAVKGPSCKQERDKIGRKERDCRGWVAKKSFSVHLRRAKSLDNCISHLQVSFEELIQSWKDL